MLAMLPFHGDSACIRQQAEGRRCDQAAPSLQAAGRMACRAAAVGRLPAAAPSHASHASHTGHASIMMERIAGRGLAGAVGPEDDASARARFSRQYRT